jgi:proteasome lid subunit RPN8/RPN11
MSDLATVVVYPTRSEAEIARARLDADGINAIVIADDEGGLNPGFYSRYGVRVVVVAAELADARESLGIEIVVVTDDALSTMVAHARSEAPIEACGLLAGADGAITKVYQMVNVDPGPDRFTLDPGEHFTVWQDASANGLSIMGSFHSHPSGPPIPSPADTSGGTDPEWVNIIIGVDNGDVALGAYRYVGDVASPVEIERR